MFSLIRMISSLFERIYNIARAHPIARRLLLCWLSFVWISFFLSMCISRLAGSFPTTALFVVTILLSIVGIAGYLFLMHSGSAFAYYKFLLPVYSMTKSVKLCRIIRWFCLLVWHDDHWLELIWKSREWNRTVHLEYDGINTGDLFEHAKRTSSLPVVVRREHINSHLWARDRAFAITLLFNQMHLEREGENTLLNIDLRDQSCAIYSNRGKQFLYSEFLPKDPTQYLNLSQEAHDFLRGHSEDDRFPFQVNALRWASGGFLPIAQWHGKQWVCLFFRDIYPVGWNIANGASETKREYKYLNDLIYREMLEELVIIHGTPRKYAHLERRMLISPGPESVNNGLFTYPLIEKHDRFRDKHDGIRLTRTRGSDITTEFTHQQVRVFFHEDWSNAEPVLTNNVLIAINPLELGIEVIRVGRFKLRDDEVLLDGEVYTSSKGEYLVRRPVVMISTDFLKQRYYENGNSLGRRPTQDASDDRKTLGPIPSEKYHLFSEELVLRRARLNMLEKQGLSTSAEAKRLQDWACKAEDKFKSAARGEGLDDDLSTLLPTTWKAIELAIEEGVL